VCWGWEKPKCPKSLGKSKNNFKAKIARIQKEYPLPKNLAKRARKKAAKANRLFRAKVINQQKVDSLNDGPGTDFDAYKRRDEKLKKMGYGSYAEYLQSELWTKIRRKGFACKGGTCVCCSRSANLLHHRSYGIETLTGKNIGSLIPMCKDCHDYIEFDQYGNKRGFSKVAVMLGILQRPKIRKQMRENVEKIGNPFPIRFTKIFSAV